MRSHQRGAVVLLVLLASALAVALVVGGPRRTAVALAATNACKSNATGTFSDISIGLTGTATPNPATAGAGTVTLGGIGFTAAVPATLLISGYNLGLLTTGSNTIPVKGWVSIAATNTTEKVKVVQFTASVTTVVTDPNGIPGSGDESATPLNLNLSLADQAFTPTGGNIAFSQGAPGSLPTIPAGQAGPAAVTPAGGIYISAQVAGGLIKANFDCQAGTSAVGGATFTPATPGAFATATVNPGGGTTVPGTTIPGTTIPGTTAPGTTAPGTTAPATTAPATTAPATTAPATTAPATTAPATTTTLPVPVNGKATYTTSCKNSVTPDLSQLTFTATGTLPGQVDADTAFDLTDMTWSVTIPASVFQTGINFGLITPGSTITGTMDLAVQGTNTVQGTQDAPKIDISIPVTTGADGQARPTTVEFAVPDMTWTARSGRIDMSMYGANVAVKIGLPNPVVFVCKPTSTPAFVTTKAVGVSTATTTTSTIVESEGPTTTAAAGGDGTLVVTGSTTATVVQVILALLLLDLGYLVLSLRRSPRRAR